MASLNQRRHSMILGRIRVSWIIEWIRLVGRIHPNKLGSDQGAFLAVVGCGWVDLVDLVGQHYQQLVVKLFVLVHCHADILVLAVHQGTPPAPLLVPIVDHHPRHKLVVLPEPQLHQHVQTLGPTSVALQLLQKLLVEYTEVLLLACFVYFAPNRVGCLAQLERQLKRLCGLLAQKVIIGFFDCLLAFHCLVMKSGDVSTGINCIFVDSRDSALDVLKKCLGMGSDFVDLVQKKEH